MSASGEGQIVNRFGGWHESVWPGEGTPDCFSYGSVDNNKIYFWPWMFLQLFFHEIVWNLAGEIIFQSFPRGIRREFLIFLNAGDPVEISAFPGPVDNLFKLRSESAMASSSTSRVSFDLWAEKKNKNRRKSPV